MSNVPKCPTFTLCKWAKNYAYMGVGGGLGLGYSHEHTFTIFVIFTPSRIGRAIFSVGKAVLKMGTSWRMQNMHLVRDDCQFQIVFEAIFLII